jgi:hypothetical protein
MTARRLMILIKGLVKDRSSNLHLEINDGWTLTDHLTAGAVDALNFSNYYYLSANLPKGKGPDKPPLLIERPGVKNPENKTIKKSGSTTASPEEMKQWLAQYDPPATEE